MLNFLLKTRQKQAYLTCTRTATAGKTHTLATTAVAGYTLNPSRSLYRLPIILGCFHRFLFIFRLLVDILPALLFRRGPLRLQEKDRQNAQQYTKSAQALTTDLG